MIEPTATGPAIVHLAPERPIFQGASYDELARRAMEFEEDVIQNGVDERGVGYRAYVISSYLGNEPKAAIVCVTDPEPVLEAHASFVRNLTLTALAIGIVGLGVGLFLARWSLLPVARALEQRERFLAAAAHELRTPVASLRAVAESALAGDEPAQEALARVGQLTERTATVVDELLLFARLDTGATTAEMEDVRLDLLVEAALPEEPAVELEAEEAIVKADPRLLRVAVRNLVENASLHGGARAIRVHISDRTLVVEDEGPGYPEAILALARGPFVVAPSNRGAGIGLATVKMIAELHGGSLGLENRESGGARATLALG